MKEKTYQIKAEEIIELAKLNSQVGYNKAIEDCLKIVKKAHMLREGNRSFLILSIKMLKSDKGEK